MVSTVIQLNPDLPLDAICNKKNTKSKKQKCEIWNETSLLFFICPLFFVSVVIAVIVTGEKEVTCLWRTWSFNFNYPWKFHLGYGKMTVWGHDFLWQYRRHTRRPPPFCTKRLRFLYEFWQKEWNSTSSPVFVYMNSVIFYTILLFLLPWWISWRAHASPLFVKDLHFGFDRTQGFSPFACINIHILHQGRR